MEETKSHKKGQVYKKGRKTKAKKGNLDESKKGFIRGHKIHAQVIPTQPSPHYIYIAYI